MGELNEPSGERAASGSFGTGRLPWTRGLLLVAVAGPALWLGGVKPWVVPMFVLVVAAMLLRRCSRSDARLRVPAMWWLGAAAGGLTLLQWLPISQGLLGLLAPELTRVVGELTAGTEITWSRLSVQPGQTGLEFARVLALTGLFVASAQLGWRLVAAYVSVAGTAVALLGLVQKLLGAQAIYGVYVPRQPLAGLGQALGSPLLTSFVNPNHQSGLLLIGAFAAAAMAVDLSGRARATRGRRASEELADRAYLAAGALTIQATALILSMSRAALLSAVVVAPLALLLTLRAPRIVGSEPEHQQRRRVVLLLLVLGMLAVALTQGAWGQLTSLRDPSSFEQKFRVARESLGLLAWSPVLGIGRGSFVDLFGLIDTAPGPVQFTHIESTPIAWLVEWGPFGGVMVLAGLLWWWRSFIGDDELGRRLCLCGLLALGIQSCADFSLDYLGVAAPAVALAGSLSSKARALRVRVQQESEAYQSGWAAKRVLLVSVLVTIVALVVAIVSIPGSWSNRQPRDQQILAGGQPAAPALADTPLDPLLHVALAREYASAGAWAAARERAGAAIRLRPTLLDAHLLAATAAAQLDAPLDAIEHLRLGLEGLREPVPEVLLEWLLARTSSPEQLAEFAPEHPQAWTALARALTRRSPVHALAFATARTRTHPDDPEPLRLLAVLALESKNPGLALHHARLLVQLQPGEIGALVLRANARFAHLDAEQDRRAVEELELALEGGRLRDPGAIEELLVVGLLRIGDRDALARAARVGKDLLARRAEPDVRRRRRELVDRIAAARQARP